jgi:hypothetical protein
MHESSLFISKPDQLKPKEKRNKKGLVRERLVISHLLVNRECSSQGHETLGNDQQYLLVFSC